MAHWISEVLLHSNYSVRHHFHRGKFGLSNYFIHFLAVDWEFLVFRFQNDVNNPLELNNSVIKLGINLKGFGSVYKFKLSASELWKVIKLNLDIIDAKFMCFVQNCWLKFSEGKIRTPIQVNPQLWNIRTFLIVKTQF